MIITDAINALIPTIHHETGKPAYLAATNAGLYRTLDPTKGWQKLPYNGNVDVRTTCISTTEREPHVIWVGTAASGVLVSRDGGQTWRQVPAFPNEKAPVNTIAQDPQRPDYVYVGTKLAFYSSHDGGETWSRRGGDLPFGDFTSILINARNGDEILVGNAYQNGETGGGVYRSVNAGKTWTRIDGNGQRLPSFRIWSLAFDGHDQNTLFVGSHSAGVYVVPRRGGTIASESQ